MEEIKKAILVTVTVMTLASTVNAANKQEWVFPDFKTLEQCKTEQMEKFDNPLTGNVKKVRNWFEKASSSQIQGNTDLAQQLVSRRYNFEIEEELSYIEGNYLKPKCKDVVTNIRLDLYRWTNKLKAMINGGKQ